MSRNSTNDQHDSDTSSLLNAFEKLKVSPPRTDAFEDLVEILQDHKYMLDRDGARYIIAKRKHYVCLICHCKLNSKHQLLDHMTEKEHFISNDYVHERIREFNEQYFDDSIGCYDTVELQSYQFYDETGFYFDQKVFYILLATVATMVFV